jgi:hypothetical protein
MLSSRRLMHPPAQLAFACCALLGIADASLPRETLTLLNADARRYAPLIVKALYRDNVAGTSMSALAETEKNFDDDSWFWTDDNAKVLEVLSLRSIFPDYLKEVGQMVKFVRGNSPPPFVFRRRADDRAVLKSDKLEDFHLATGLMNFHGNLRGADLRQGYRFHDSRKVDAVEFTGDDVGFTVKGKAFKAEVKQTASAEIRREARAVTFVHTSELRAATAVAGWISYAYRVEQTKPYMTLDVTVKSAPGITLDNVEVTTALEQMDSLSPIRYSKFFAHLGSAAPATAKAQRAPEVQFLRRGPVKWWTVFQDANLGDSTAVTTIVNSPERLRDITSSGEHDGVFHRVCARYDLGTVEPGQTVTVSEKKVLLSGGLYNNMGTYDGVFSKLDDYPGLDLSISYDIGAELNGVASVYLADMQRLSARPGLAPVAYEPETRAWIDAIVDAYFANFPIKIGNGYPYIFTRGHAFIVLALDTMYQATKDSKYLDQMRRLTDVLVDLQSTKGQLKNSFKCNDHFCFLDCHAAAMVAAARAAVATGDRRYAEAALRGLLAYRVDPEAPTGRQVFVYTGVHPKDEDGIYWIFKAGLLLRSLESLVILDERKLIRLTRDNWLTIQDLRKRAIGYIARTVHSRGKYDELFTCHKAGETNSETQAWAMLGMYRIEHERTEGR